MLFSRSCRKLMHNTPCRVISTASASYTKAISKHFVQQWTQRYTSWSSATCSFQQLNGNPPNATEIEQDVSNISSAVTLIHLTQTIYFQPNPSAIMAEDLMHWVNRESGPDEVEGAEIMKTHPPCHHPSYWTFLHK